MAENYVLLERTELNASAASVTFANIPQTGYTDLKIVMSSRADSTQNLVDIKFNSSSVGYTRRSVYGDGTSASSASGSDSQNLIQSISTNTASTFGNTEIYIPNYTSSNYKSVSMDTVQENNATAATALLGTVLWSNTAAITTVSLTPVSGNFVQYSTFSLYGLAAVGTTPAIAPKAYGGNVIATDGTYWYHAFTSSGTFTPQVGLTADVLTIAGGGGGAGGNGGGGGAGGLVYSSSQSLLNGTNYSCTIGAGGTGGAAGQTNGSNSVFSSITSTGGGRGGNGNGATGLSGGSGGGGGYGSSTGGAGTSGQGNNGGGGTNAAYGGGGGGGAGSAGGNSTSTIGGNGGAGTNTY